MRKVENLSLCDKAPIGWFCTRDLNHTGPCAAVSVGYSIVHAALNGLRGAKYSADQMGSSWASVDMVDVNSLISFLESLEKFSEPSVLGFPISSQSLTPTWWEEDHKQGRHTYSAFCLLCTAG